MSLTDKSLDWLHDEEMYYSSAIAEMKRRGLRREAARLSSWLTRIRRAISLLSGVCPSCGSPVFEVSHRYFVCRSCGKEF